MRFSPAHLPHPLPIPPLDTAPPILCFDDPLGLHLVVGCNDLRNAPAVDGKIAPVLSHHAFMTSFTLRFPLLTGMPWRREAPVAQS